MTLHVTLFLVYYRKLVPIVVLALLLQMSVVMKADVNKTV